jgi:diguanylate cyclase (GGDEF)-like protein
MGIKRTSLFYDFYQGLLDRFTTIDGLMAHALPLIAQYLDADNIFFFNWDEKNSVISQRLMCENGKCYYLQEDIYIDDKSPEILKFLQDGIGDSPTLDYPAVYSLLAWRTPINSLRTLQSGERTRSQYGVLRVERFKKNKPFTQSDKEILLGICRELSVKMNMTEVDQYNIAQLRRAQALNDLAQVFATSIRLSDSLEEILKSIQRSFHFDRTSLFLIDLKTDKLQEAISVDLSGEVEQIEITKELNRKFSAKCGDTSESCPVLGASDRALTLPLKLQNKNLGWLVFENVLSRIPIAQEDILSLRQFSAQIALAIDNARLFEKVQELSNYDELTKLALRRFFNESLAQEIYRSKRFNLTFSIILMDIDHFKDINDNYGHIIGDEALKAVSDVIRGSLRQTDIPCRYGGDEIVILLPRTSGEEAVSIAKRLSDKVKAVKLPERITRGIDIQLSISQGISVFPYDSEEQKDLIKRADDALYHVKETGRGGWELYSDTAQKGTE